MTLYEDAVLSDTPVAFYPLSENASAFGYDDLSGNNHHIELFILPDTVTGGVNSVSSNARLSKTGLAVPTEIGSLHSFSYELWFKSDQAGTYTFLESQGGGTDVEVLANISPMPGSPSTRVVKFGLGVGSWDINEDTFHHHIFVYSDDAQDLFDGQWHHLVFTWDGVLDSQWSSDQLAIYIDGVRRDDEDMRSMFDDVGFEPPVLFEDPLFVGGPSTGENAIAAAFSNIALYNYALDETSVIGHFNSSSVIEAIAEVNEASSFIRSTNGELETVSEIELVGNFQLELGTIDFEGFSSISVSVETPDMLSARDILSDSGTIGLSLANATLEPGEPNTGGYTKTLWYELVLNPDFTQTQRIVLTSPTSVGRVTVYKQPSLDDYDDFEDLDEDEQAEQDPMLSEPELSKLVRVQAGAADQVFTLDQDYGSSYFLQVGLISGPGDDFTMTWGDADPAQGGLFANPFEGENAVGEVHISSKNAWLEPGEPNAAGINETRSVWLRWSAPESLTGPTIFAVRPDEAGTPFAFGIYTGTAVNALSQVDTALSLDGTESELLFTATPGQEYYIRVATTADDVNFIVSWAAPRKDYAPAEPVTQLRVTVHAGVAGAKLGGKTYAANELITELPNRVGAQFQERLNVPGSGSITLMQNDMMIRAFNPDDWPSKTDDPWTNTTQSTWGKDPFQLVQMGNIIKFWMFNSTKGENGQEDCVSAFIIKNREITVVGTGEEADRMITLSGPTVHQLLNDMVVMHDNWPDVRSNPERGFNWASVYGGGDAWTGDGWFDASGTHITNKRAWNHPINNSAFTNPPGWKKKRTEARTKRPKYALVARALKKGATNKWPDKGVRWMWMTGTRSQNQDKTFPPAGMKLDGTHYYRSKGFNVKVDRSKHRFSVYCDTEYRIYLDGELIISGNGNENFTKFKTVTLTLRKSISGVRTHQLAVYVRDKSNGGTDHNDAFLLSVQRLNAKGKAVGVVIRSTGREKWYAWHGPNPPQWSRAMILAKVIREAKERGNHSAQALVLRSTFGRVSEEGTAWFDTKAVGMNIEVGTSVLSLQESFSESNRFDVWVDPDTLAVRAWQGTTKDYPRGDNKANNVALVPGHNLINYTVNELDEMKNALLVRYNGGNVYVKADNPEREKQFGRREGFVELGDLNSHNAALQRGTSLLSWLGSPTTSGGSEDVVGHINEEYNGSIIPVKGSVPFLDFNVGDVISAPASNGILHPHRVMSLTCTEDAEGNLTFDPELQGQ